MTQKALSSVWMAATAFLLITLPTMSCREQSATPAEKSGRKPSMVTPPAIRILPLGRVPKAMVQSATEELRKVFPDVKVLPAEAMPAHAWYPKRARWRADTLIRWMGMRASAGEVWLGITTEDISSTKEGVAQDFGIMGLGQKPGHACVASDKRLKDKSQFHKIVIHELGHTAGLNHCPSDRCLMRAANGKDHTREIDTFCPRCREVLLNKGWKI